MWPIARPAAERRVALLVVIAFLVIGSAWILFTDILLYSVIQDRAIVARLETAKGWTFVALAALVLYLVTLRSAARLANAYRTVSAVVESIGDGVLILGADRAIAYANPASIQMLRTGLDDLRGMGAQEFSRRFQVSYPDGRMVPPGQFVSQRVFDEAGPIRYKAVLYPPGGPELVFICTAAAVRSEDEKPAEIVVSVLHDITAVEHLERLRDELFTTAAHAIKTPVAIVKSASQILSTGDPAHVERSAAIIERQCGRIERMVENILALSRIRSGTLQLHRAEVDLGPIVESVASELARATREHEISVRLNAQPRVRADPERLEMALRNAIHAASRSSRPGGPVSVQLTEREGDAEIDVSYEPFTNGSDAGDMSGHRTDFDDIGVGRDVTALIVEAHGGGIVEQADGGTATVRIRIPALTRGAA